MGFFHFISLLCFFSFIHAQQPYVGKTTTNCTDISNSVLGYSCNGVNSRCQSFLIFRSLPPHNTVASISELLASDSSRLAEINSVSDTATFETNREVIVPVNCSCSGEFYQVNTTYVVKQGESFFSIANNTLQGLTTCQAIQDQTSFPPTNLTVGASLTLPLRCACPTKNQTDQGLNFLVSYTVVPNDIVSAVSERFNAGIPRILEANQLSSQDPEIFPTTTLLVPLEEPPSGSQTIPPPPPPASSPPPPPSSQSSNNSWVYILVGVLGGSVLILLVGTVIFYVFLRRTKRPSDSVTISGSYDFEAREKPMKKKLEEDSQEFFQSLSSISKSLKPYSFEELESATANFSHNSWIKGSVYRGTINGDFAAIKRVDGDVSKEIELLTKINHSNLIRLSGVCFHSGHWYLVYEYAVNGPLSGWIYRDNHDRKFLNWSQRMQIALDVATGLNYLHSFTSPPHIHKDIRSTNILLGSDFRAKISNFALARSTDGEEGQFALTKHIVGTKGYMAPEYLENGLISTKLDVYAFGVLMLEIITGKEAAVLHGNEKISLSQVLNSLLEEGDGQNSLFHFMDPSLLGNYPMELAPNLIRLIQTCLNKNPASRPAMDDIVHSLSRILATSLNWELSNT